MPTVEAATVEAIKFVRKAVSRPIEVVLFAF